MRSPAQIAPNREALHPFDLKYGTDTGGYLSPEELVTGQTNDSLNYGYSAIAPSVFRAAIERWRGTLPALAGRVEAYTFVDVGAGKGRVLLLASELPFRKVIGVELHPRLAEIAERNVEQWNRITRNGSAIRVVKQDALKFRWPRPPLLVYLYNPFHCSVVAQLAQRLCALPRSAAGLIDVLYVNPTCADALSANGSFSHLSTVRIQMSEADQKADPYNTSNDLVFVFRRTR